MACPGRSTVARFSKDPIAEVPGDPACPSRRRLGKSVLGSPVARRVAATVFLGFLTLTTGCRYHMVFIEDGAPLSRADYDQITVGVASRNDVLETLGAPDRVSYTLDREILDYKGAGHRGSELQFVLPTVVFQWGSLTNIAIGAAKRIAPSDGPKSIREEVWVIRLSRFVFGSLLSLSPFETGSTDTVTLTGQRLRYDRIRLVLDRHSQRVVGKSMLDAAAVRNGSALRDAFLIEAD